MKALIVGGAECVWDDLEAARELMPEPDAVIAINDIGVHLERVDHWVSLHGEKFERDPDHKTKAGWVEQRRRAGLPMDLTTWTRRGRRGGERKVHHWLGGSSGLTACRVAHEIGVTRGILCGVPMTRTPHFHESNTHVLGRNWSPANTHRKKWVPRLPELREFLRSMSGWTREQLGYPTPEWIRADHE